MDTGIWDYRQGIGHRPGMDLSGFTVEATDGRIGKVDKHDDQSDAGHIVVDTGVWIFGRHVLLPIGTIALVDPDERVVHIDRSREEIRNAPEFEPDKNVEDPEYEQRIGAYYLMRPWS